MHKIALLEIGRSHYESMLSQMIALKNANCYIILCSDRLFFEQNTHFSSYIDEFHEISLSKSKIGRFIEMKRFNRWMKHHKIDMLIANTAHGKDIRNLCITASSRIPFVGIMHTIKGLQHSFTQRIISKKIKHYFVLNNTLKQKAYPQKGVFVHSFYPLNFPYFEPKVIKPLHEFWIIIIGGLQSSRRDLDGFIKLAIQTPENVHFYFLGNANDHNVEVQQFKQKCEQSNIFNRIHLFQDYLSNSEFYGYAQQADGILPLIHPNTLSGKELLSQQITGAVPLALGLKIPMLIHEHYKTWEDFHISAVFYNFNNFQEQLRLFQQDRETLYNKMKSEPKFSAELHNKRFADFILSLI